MATLKNRNLTLDSLKIVLAFMVIGIHAQFFNDINLLSAYLFQNGLFTLAVPVFFIINGYYFHKIYTKGMVKKWVIRIIVLYIVWMLLYLNYWFIYPNGSIVPLKVFIKYIIVGYGHLWYIIATLCAGILLYFMLNISDIKISIIALILFFIGVFLQYIDMYQLFYTPFISYIFEVIPTYRNFIFFAFPFFTIGFFISKNNISTIINKKQVVLITVVGFIFLFCESFTNYYLTSGKTGASLFFSLIIISPALFLLVLKFQITGNNKYIASMATSIYLVHIFFLNIYEESWIYGGTLLTIVTFIISIIFSYFLIKINKKVKFLL